MILHYETENSLMHYGVPGMKWGHRKAKYTTVAQGMRRAKAAGQDAWRKTTTEKGGKLVGKSKSVAVYKNPVAKMKGKNAANKAYNDAANKSLQESKAHNKQLRASKNNISKGKTLAQGIINAVGLKAITEVAAEIFVASGKEQVAKTINNIGTLSSAAVVGATVSQVIK